MDFKEGFFDISESDYRAAPFINKSGLDQIAKSPGHYQWSLKNQKPKTPAMGFGTAFHSYVLETHLFEKTYMIIEDCSKASKFYKELELEAKASDKLILFESDFERISAMACNLLTHERAKELMKSSKSEQVMFFKLRASNGNEVLCKAKLDCIKHGVISDIKTTSNASKNEFIRSIHSYKYHIQDALYCRGAEALTGEVHEFYFLAVESEAPFGVNVFKLGEASKNLAYSELYRCIDRYEESLRENHWPYYPQEIQTVELPGYAFKSN